MLGLGLGLNKKNKGLGFNPNFILRQDFNTLEAAPIPTPLTGEIGELVVVQNDGNFAVTADGLVINTPQVTPAYGDLGVLSTTPVPREPGMTVAMLWELPTTDRLAGVLTGFRTNTTGVSFDNQGASYSRSSFGREIYTLGILQRIALDYPFGIDETILSIVLRPTGAFFIQNQQLIGVGYNGTQANLYPFATYHNASAPQLKYMRAGLIPSATDANLAIYQDVSPTNGDVFEAEQDSLIYIDWTPTASDVLDIMFRRIDDDNTMIYRFSQTGTIQVITKNAGVEVVTASSAATFNIATTYKLGMRFTDNRPCAWSGSVRLEPIQAFNSSITGVKIIGTTANLANLDVWKVDLPTKVLSEYNVFTNPFLS